jgi:hypothetical protein
MHLRVDLSALWPDETKGFGKVPSGERHLFVIGGEQLPQDVRCHLRDPPSQSGGAECGKGQECHAAVNTHVGDQRLAVLAAQGQVRHAYGGVPAALPLHHLRVLDQGLLTTLFADGEPFPVHAHVERSCAAVQFGHPRRQLSTEVLSNLGGSTFWIADHCDFRAS